ncbi:SH3 domain-containing protein [Emticicia sp. 17c]|uniref:SH3 domain-containing protein n=1 Tax=Emticicia sp. 17c TaxID=3127704 RepID=UPI00301D5D35
MFKQKKFDEAASIYEKIASSSATINPKIYLKLANIYENKGDFVKELYYLNLYSFRYADERVFEKIYTIATENGYKGYEKNDLNYFLYYFRQYSNYVWIVFLLIGIYVFVVFIIKKNNQQFTPTHHKVIFIIYLIFLAVFINLPNNYRTVIIKNEQVYLRDYPSAGSHIIGSISEGHRLSVINSEDIWYQVLWDGKFCYLKQSDVLLIH